ncbi:hypothetical protein K432DRAFT_231484 [Lepidopterella palustris CBS 459.81]|uniref:Uncharacterized protein n=1 Tax=Lepidopterella palustris CBS 459.81 TaxID=1314670 RepID=A0A8E2EDT5_9PEZI|nr:hypothetical protein K432DRAFT_231484 [Lepidopterella palustris CBS 459.81]
MNNPTRPPQYRHFYAGAFTMLIPGGTIAFYLALSVLVRCAPLCALKHSHAGIVEVAEESSKEVEDERSSSAARGPYFEFQGPVYHFIWVGGCAVYMQSVGVGELLEMVGNLYCSASLSSVVTVLFVYLVLLNLVEGVD